MGPEWVEMARRGGAVRRYHTISIVGHETVAEHSFGVACLVLWLTDGAPSLELIKAAIYHDMAEQQTGDSPAPAKWNNSKLRDGLAQAELEFETKYGINVQLRVEDEIILRWADMLDLLLFCVDQRRLGNVGLSVVFDNGVDYLLNRCPAHERGTELLAHVRESYVDF